MRGSTANAWRAVRGLLAAVAVADVAYRLVAREPLRRALGIEAKRA
jgi:hypothetical protein